MPRNKRRKPNSAFVESMIQSLQATSQCLDAAFDSCRAPLCGTSPATAPPPDLGQPELLLEHRGAQRIPVVAGRLSSAILRVPLELSIRLESFTSPAFRVLGDKD